MVAEQATSDTVCGSGVQQIPEGVRYAAAASSLSQQSGSARLREDP